MFAIDTRNCHRVLDYEKTLALYSRRPALRSKNWDANERPLDNSRKPHMRIVRENDTFGLYLYRTCLVRYHEPQPDGRRVDYTGHCSVSSTKFFNDVAGVEPRRPLRVRTTQHDGYREVVIAHGALTSLWYTDHLQRIVDPDRCKVPTLYQNRASKELLAWRRLIADKLAPVFDLFDYRAEELVTARWQDNSKTQGYTADRIGSVSDLDTVWVQAWPDWRADPTNDRIEKLRNAYDTALLNSVDVRWRGTDDTRDDEVPAWGPIAASARRAVLFALYKSTERHSGVDPLYVRLYIPAFPESVPGTYCVE